MRTKKWFGYTGDPLVYWLYASSKADLLRQIAARGMGHPDWIDGE